MAPVRSAITLQFVPNWNAMTMPLTTPMPKDNANTFSQKSKTRRKTTRPVNSRAPSIVASQAARPMVKGGKMMGKLMTEANWMRDRMTGSSSMIPKSGRRSRGGRRCRWRTPRPAWRSQTRRRLGESSPRSSGGERGRLCLRGGGNDQGRHDRKGPGKPSGSRGYAMRGPPVSARTSGEASDPRAHWRRNIWRRQSPHGCLEQDRNPRTVAAPSMATQSIVLRRAVGCVQSLHVLWRQLWPIERDGHFVDLARERERNLIVVVIDRRGTGAADVERLVERQDQGKSPFQLRGRYELAIHRQRPGAAATHAAQVVVRQRRLAKPVVLEVVHDPMLAGGQYIRSLPTGPLEVKQVVCEYRLALQQIQPIPDKSSPLVNDHALSAALRHFDVGGNGVGGVEQARLVAVRYADDRAGIGEDRSACCRAGTRCHKPR